MGLIEYVLLIALIAIGLTTVILMLGGAIGSGFDSANETITDVAGPSGCRNPIPGEKNPNC